MSALEVVTLVAVGLLVAALAAFLVALVAQLARARRRTTHIAAALVSVGDRLVAAEPLLRRVNEELRGLGDAEPRRAVTRVRK